MKTYLVGGAVRDALLGKTVHERDYVVVGATPEQMLALGYRQVGKDFPVFLHPQTQEEYALARTERKAGTGYTGFVVNADPTVTLEDDLLRRDLTVNAMAQDADGTIIDPYGGQSDLQSRVLRHVSPAFSEDPLRVLRVARFAARFASDGFGVAPETLELMKDISATGELKTLSAERVWRETEKALTTNHPNVYWQVLADSSALTDWFTELNARDLLSRMAPRLNELQQIDSVAAFVLSVYELSVAQVDNLCERLRVPNKYHRLAQLAVQCNVQASSSFTPELAFELFNTFDAWRQPQRIEAMLTIWQCIGIPESTITALKQALAAAQVVSAQEVIQQAQQRGESLQGAAISHAVNAERLAKIQAAWPI